MLSRESPLLDEFNRAFNEHDVEGMMALMTADCVFENTFPAPDGSRHAGQTAVKQFWVEFFQSSPRAWLEIEDLFADDERGFQRWIYRWVDEQGVAGHVRGVDIFQFRDGKIAEKLSYVKG